MSRRPLASLLAALALAAQAHAEAYTTPHHSLAAGAETLFLNGENFVNQGLVAAGRLSAEARDFNGDTLGSFSSMALRDWKRLSDGSYVGVIETLPDRGPNGVGGLETSDYAARLHRHRVRLDPKTGALAIVPDGGVLLRDATGKTFTGRDPGAGLLTRAGVAYPSPRSGAGAGHISLDAEGVSYRADGGFYVSDEYAAGVYLFDKTGRQVGAIPAVAALLPRLDDRVNFNAETAPRTGRRNNQGMEGVSVSPDGSRLFVVLQSAAMQDSKGSLRNITRVLVYDISTTRAPRRPVGHYALALPTYALNGDGKAADQTAAQSEIVAVNNRQFLILVRDGNGRGKGTAAPPVYKAILLSDIDGATNLAGGAYENTAKPVAPDGVLDASIKPVATAELINILNPGQLARRGLDLNTRPSTPSSLPEKIEAMALAPALDPAAPDDYFLLVGSDNDFEAAKGRVNGVDFDASLTNKQGSGVGDNDSLILVYRVTLPGRRSR